MLCRFINVPHKTQIPQSLNKKSFPLVYLNPYECTDFMFENIISDNALESFFTSNQSLNICSNVCGLLRLSEL